MIGLAGDQKDADLRQGSDTPQRAVELRARARDELLLAAADSTPHYRREAHVCSNRLFCGAFAPRYLLLYRCRGFRFR